MKKASTGIKFLDKLLEGGIELDAITTIYGPAGAGKTNLALLASLECAKNGKTVIYIDTEGGFSISRLKQILPNHRRLLDKFIFLKPTSFEEQKHAIQSLRHLVNKKVGLIVVDTITMLYRLSRSFKEEGYNRELGLQMLTLNEIARKQGIPVLITSQVYSAFENKGVRIVGGDILAYPSKCLIELEHTPPKRKLKIKKHRSIASKEKEFKIVEKGIKETTPQQTPQS